MLTRLLTAHLLMMLVAAPSMRQAMSCTINPTGIIREGVLQAQNGMVGRCTRACRLHIGQKSAQAHARHIGSTLSWNRSISAGSKA